MNDAVIIGLGLALVASSKPIPWGAGWMWPVPSATFDGAGYPAVVSQGFHAPAHMGVDIVYRRRSRKDRPEYPSGSTNGSPMHFAPPGVPVFAAKAGTVWSVTKSPRGWSVVINHGAPFATFYQHMDSVIVAKGMPVIAGTMLGTMGWDPLDAQRLRHLHFAVWYNGHGDSASVDPAGVIGKWTRPPLTWKA